MGNKNIWQIRYESLVEVLQEIALKELVSNKITVFQYRDVNDTVAEAFLRAEDRYKKGGEINVDSDF